MRKVLLFTLLAVAFFWSCDSVCAAIVRFHFINVGHGDAILIEREGIGVALIDAGKPEAGPLILDYIRGLGIERIDRLFVTHNHKDHIGGVPIILDSLDVGIVYHTGMVHDWEEAQAFRQYLDTGKWPEEILGAGDVPLKDGDLEIEVLSPLREETEGKAADPNPNSMVLLVKHGSVRVLLPADIYQEREKWLIGQYGSRLKCNALKASHHGSRAGNCKDFLKVVQPDVIVVSVGPNDWGYPSKKTMKRLQKYCSRVLRTDRDGTVILESDGHTLKIVEAENIAP